MSELTTHTDDDGMKHLSVADAITAVERCSFTAHHPTDMDEREITHVFIGTMGADWNTSDVIAALREAIDIAWMDHTMWGKCLVFLNGEGRLRACDQVKPL